MTTVVCDVRHEVDGELIQSEGSLRWRPTARREASGALVLPQPFVVDLDSDATAPLVDVEPSTDVWAWMVWERVPGGASQPRYLAVPDSAEPVQYVDLVAVDPISLEPLPDAPETVQEAIGVIDERVTDLETQMPSFVDNGDGTITIEVNA